MIKTYLVTSIYLEFKKSGFNTAIIAQNYANSIRNKWVYAKRQLPTSAQTDAHLKFLEAL